MCLCLGRIVADTLLADGDRLAERVVEETMEIAAGGTSRKVRARLAEIVLDGDRALIQQEPDPDAGREQPVSGRIVGIRGDRLFESCERLGVVVVVAEVQSACPKRRGLLAIGLMPS